MYLSVVKPWGRTPSATSPATRVMPFSHGGEEDTLGRGRPMGPGWNIGFMSVKR